MHSLCEQLRHDSILHDMEADIALPFELSLVGQVWGFSAHDGKPFFYRFSKGDAPGR
jgi:hypothetical protein